MITIEEIKEKLKETMDTEDLYGWELECEEAGIDMQMHYGLRDLSSDTGTMYIEIPDDDRYLIPYVQQHNGYSGDDTYRFLVERTRHFTKKDVAFFENKVRQLQQEIRRYNMVISKERLTGLLGR